ncbi:CHASE2 domain-containing protein [Pseudoxanthomonas winnipegensis]|jgi:HD-GYP domain-containing protein (c-di-GMP phosphodiesterase class II)|uniref:CHASE2 domain-containing protein n=1 Tax=Pseudoxanthomonas winnipegensis TaxID=2480810 RepID=A0A4Q8L5W7_9GAMM|nr:CHASE2 domain-containing protein [Pseudoxanthomonas winnipegensis]TAA21695.1 CHASE2 domain-containing protein [Pseudoxanthomonas winnipegensis]
MQLAPALTGFPQRQRIGFLLLAVLLAAAMVATSLWQDAPAARLDRALLDRLLVHAASGVQAPDAVVVDIDEVSLAAVGQWPWPRYRLATLIERVAAQHPAAIALDVLLPEADRTSLTDIQQTFKRDFDLDVRFAGVPAGLLDNDGYLAQVMARHEVVGARYFYFDHATDAAAPARPGVGFDGRLDLLHLAQAPGVLDNVAPIAARTRTAGFVNIRVDDDGQLRRAPLLIAHRGVLHASLALAATMQALGVRGGHVERDRDGLSLRIGNHRVPIDASGNARLRFNGGPAQYASLPAVEVLAGQAREQDLRGKIVFIGSSAVGLNDLHRTALDRDFSGVKLQAALAQNLMDGNAVRLPAWGPGAALLTSVLGALLLAWMFAAGRGLGLLSALAVLMAAGLLALTAAVFARIGMFLPTGAPLLTLGLLLALCFILRMATQHRRAQRWRRELENARQVTIESMAAVAETRDPETGAHIKRTQHYVRAVARQLQRSGHHTDILTREYIDLLFLSAPLHDIGKVGVPDHILLKPGALTAEELVIMRRHAEYGRQIILSTAGRIEGDNFLLIAGDIAATHHEKWDGSGYPAGLKGQDIPLAGRIMAVADIYDALISRRCYKDPFPHARAKAMMLELRGTTFDPVVLDAFFQIEAEVLQIAARYRDEDDAPDADWDDTLDGLDDRSRPQAT